LVVPSVDAQQQLSRSCAQTGKADPETHLPSAGREMRRLEGLAGQRCGLAGGRVDLRARTTRLKENRLQGDRIAATLWKKPEVAAKISCPPAEQAKP
jgi:hypothetical protein